MELFVYLRGEGSRRPLKARVIIFHSNLARGLPPPQIHQINTQFLGRGYDDDTRRAKKKLIEKAIKEALSREKTFHWVGYYKIESRHLFRVILNSPKLLVALIVSAYFSRGACI